MSSLAAMDLWPEETPDPIAHAWDAAAGANRGIEPDVAYQQRPEDWMVDVLGIPRETIRWSLNPGYEAHTWDGTPDPLVAMLEGLAAWEDVGVEAGTGTQKSYTAAAAILWFLACWRGARVFTFAPKEDQLRLYIWTEIGKHWARFAARFPTAQLTDLCIRMNGVGDDSWGARGYAVAIKAGEVSSTNAAGMHAEHMMLVYEETPGIANAVLEAGENTCTAPHNIRLALGNPDHQFDTLHNFCTGPNVRAIRVSALDHPNLVTGEEIVPGAASRKAEERRRLKYGVDGRLYMSRVRGISPSESAEALIKLEWVRAAQARHGDAAYRVGQLALGVDVANSIAGDEGAIARWKGRTCVSVESFPCPDSNALGHQVARLIRAEKIDGAHVGVDSVGVGAGTVNTLKERELYVKALNGGESPRDRYGEEESFNNLRSQMWWTLAEDLRKGEIALPNDPELAQELITPQWKTQNGKIVIEQKEEIKKRLPGGRSPNKGDAVVYGNFVRDREPMAEPLRQRGLTLKERIQAELDALDQERPAADASRYGTVVRQ